MKKYVFIIAILILAVAFGVYMTEGYKTTNTVGNVISNAKDSSKLTVQVNIPCLGHAGLINYELQKLEGIESVNFRAPNLFEIYYLPDKITEENILRAEVFKEYPAKIVN